MEHLQDAIHVGQAAIDATPEDCPHPDRAVFLNGLWIVLGNRYLKTRSIDGLQEAIRIGKTAVDATPEDHLNRAVFLNNLGARLSDRYFSTGSINDL